MGVEGQGGQGGQGVKGGRAFSRLGGPALADIF